MNELDVLYYGSTGMIVVCAALFVCAVWSAWRKYNTHTTAKAIDTESLRRIAKGAALNEASHGDGWEWED